MVDDWLANAYEGMSRRQFLARAGAAGVGLAGFALASGSVGGEVISTSAAGLSIVEARVPSADFPVPIYAAYPTKPGKFPVLVVIPEIFGMHEHLKDVTRRFAREGFFSITFEPYAREGGVLHISDIAEVRKVVNAVPDKRVMTDLDAVVAYARQQPSASSDRIGVTGFCRGGMYTLLYCAHNHEVKAAASWYGQLRPEKKEGIRTVGPLDIADNITAPVLGLYGEADLGIPVADVKEMETRLKAAHRVAEFVVYPGAPHAFFADYRPSYRPAAAQDAWSRSLVFFSRYLKQ